MKKNYKSHQISQQEIKSPINRYITIAHGQSTGTIKTHKLQEATDLDEVGRKLLTTVAVKECQGSAEGRSGDSQHHGTGHNLPPRLLQTPAVVSQQSGKSTVYTTDQHWCFQSGQVSLVVVCVSNSLV